MEIVDFEAEEIGRMVTLNMKGIPPNTKSVQVTVRINGDDQGKAAVSPKTQQITFGPNREAKRGIIKVEIETDQGTLEAESKTYYIPHGDAQSLGNKAPGVDSLIPKTQQPGGVVKLVGKQLDRVRGVRLGGNNANQAKTTIASESQASFVIPATAKTSPNPQTLWLLDKSGIFLRTRFTVTVQQAGNH
jgi:hypothetical protein